MRAASVMCGILIGIAALLIAAGTQPTLVSADHIPSPLPLNAPFVVREKWVVVNGYNSGPCHYRDGCQDSEQPSGDQYFALDLQCCDSISAASSQTTGGREVKSPIVGRIARVIELPAGTGQGVEIDVGEGYIVHLHHLMNVRVQEGTTVQRGQVIGYVFDQYNAGSNNHLHIQVTDAFGASQPMRISGRFYAELTGTNQWYGQVIGSNALYDEFSYVGAYEVILQSSRQARLNDRAGSATVNPGCELILYEDLDYQGRSSPALTIDVPDLGQASDRVSSYKLRCSSTSGG